MAGGLSIWRARLESAATRVLQTATEAAAPLDPTGFRDDFGHRPALARPLIAWVTGQQAEPSPGATTPDVGLWWALIDPDRGVETLLMPGAGAPLLSLEQGTAIEVSTEAELAALHALWALARVRGRPEWRRRALAAAAWHVENMQPDNATNHPWAVHVFLHLEEATGDAKASLHAQTLLHNCQVALGRPDLLSAFVLKDAARELIR